LDKRKEESIPLAEGDLGMQDSCFAAVLWLPGTDKRIERRSGLVYKDIRMD